MNPDRQEVLNHRIEKADNVIRYSVVSAVVVLVIVLVIIVVQLFVIQKQIDASNARTQQYVRCIADAIVVPLAKRGSINFDNCSNSKTDAEDNPKPTSNAQPATPGQASSAPAPRAQDNVATEPRPPVVPQAQVAPQQPAATPTPASTPGQPRGLVPSVLDGVTGTVNGVVGGLRQGLGL